MQNLLEQLPQAHKPPPAYELSPYCTLKRPAIAQPHHLSQRKKIPESVLEIIQHKILDMDEMVDGDNEDPFYVADLGDVRRQHSRFTSSLPRVEPFYAVKCNPDPMVLKTLNSLGTGFDCASKGEMQAVLEMGVDPSRIIYANPCKQISHLRFAAKHQIKMMTFDNADELEKIASVHPNAQLVLRILTDDSKALCKLGLKFGASLDVVPALLVQARSLNLQIIGFSFHVGSGCYDTMAFVDALVRARKAFDIAESLGFHLTLLDIGGGFPGNLSTGIQFGPIAAALGPAIDKLFPTGVKVIAEPGRYYVSAAFTLCVSVTSRRVIKSESTDPNSKPASYMYYVNDGMYGSFNCITFDHATVKADVLVRNGSFVYGKSYVEPMYPSSIWGPTCDSIDCIGKDLSLPCLNVGDWLMYKDMGAYTLAASSTFNGFKRSTILYTDTEI